MEITENEMAHPQFVLLDIIIVGAGIIGFAAAAALGREGHKITVGKSCSNSFTVAN
jgi:thioredoxin reductase